MDFCFQLNTRSRLISSRSLLNLPNLVFTKKSSSDLVFLCRIPSQESGTVTLWSVIPLAMVWASDLSLSKRGSLYSIRISIHLEVQNSEIFSHSFLLAALRNEQSLIILRPWGETLVEIYFSRKNLSHHC